MRKMIIITGVVAVLFVSVWWFSRLEYRDTVLEMVQDAVLEESGYLQGHLNDHFNFLILDILEEYNTQAPPSQADLWENVRHLIVANPFLKAIDFINSHRQIKYGVPYEPNSRPNDLILGAPVVEALESALDLGRPVMSRPYLIGQGLMGYSIVVPSDNGGFFQLVLEASKLFSSQGGHSHRKDILLRVLDEDTVVYESEGFSARLEQMDNRFVLVEETLYDRPIRLIAVPSGDMNVSNVIYLRVALVSSFLVSVLVLAALVLIQTMNSKEREKVARELEFREKTLIDTFDAVQDGISILDQDLVIVRVNKTLERWYSQAMPLIGRKCYAAYHERTEPCPVCPTIEAMNSGQPSQADIPLMRDGEQQGWLEVYSYPKFDSDGSPNGVVEYFRDITQRRLAEEALREREEQYRSFFENNHAMMLTLDPDTGQIIDANPAACSFYGYDHQDIKQMKITDLNTLSREELLTKMDQAKKSYQKYFNFSHRLANGEIREVEVYSGPVRFQGKDYLFSIVHDITERKLVERERERLIAELKEALSEVKTLQGFIPICANCKKIRDDEGYWQRLEKYIQDHSQAKFSHSICPECKQILYPELYQTKK